VVNSRAASPAGANGARERAAVVLVAEQLRRAAPGGIGTYVTGLARGLAQLAPPERPRLELLASRRPRRHRDPLAALALPARCSPLPSRALVAAWSLGLLGARPPGGSPAPWVLQATSLAFPTPRAGGRLVVTVHDLLWREVPEAFPPRGRRWHEAALRRAARLAAAFVVPSEETRQRLLRAGLGVAAARVAVIPYGADHLPPPDEAATSALLERVGVRGDFLLAVGTLEPRKNLRRLVLAHELAGRRLGGDLALLVVGPRGWGPDAASHEARAGSVRFAGPVAAAVLAGLYRRARALAYVPLAEGYGLPPLEALALGTPVVASPVPSVAGVAFEVDPLDVEAIAEALVRVVADEELRRLLVERGRAHAGSRRWVETARAHVAWWREVLTGSGR
jgi:glycosyltransferase involved in cell wall biosynthesis